MELDERIKLDSAALKAFRVHKRFLPSTFSNS